MTTLIKVSRYLAGDKHRLAVPPSFPRHSPPPPLYLTIAASHAWNRGPQEACELIEALCRGEDCAKLLTSCCRAARKHRINLNIAAAAKAALLI
jgi:hypothetical protein